MLRAGLDLPKLPIEILPRLVRLSPLPITIILDGKNSEKPTTTAIIGVHFGRKGVVYFFCWAIIWANSLPALNLGTLRA